MRREIDPQESGRAVAFEMWMSSLTPLTPLTPTEEGGTPMGSLLFVLLFETFLVFLFGVLYGIFIASQGSKGCKLCCTVPHRHSRMTL